MFPSKVGLVRNYRKFVKDLLLMGEPTRIAVGIFDEPTLWTMVAELLRLPSPARVKYGIRYTVVFDNQTMSWREPRFTVTLTGVDDELENIWTSFGTAEKRVQYIRKLFPGADIVIVDANDGVLTPDVLVAMQHNLGSPERASTTASAAR